MVDWNNETTVATAPADVLRILIIQRRDYVLDAIMAKMKLEDRAPGKLLGGTEYVVRAAVFTLFLGCRAMLERSMKPEEFKELAAYAEAKEYNKVLEAFYKIDTALDQKKVTRVDVKANYDHTDVGEEDKQNGL